MSQQYLQRDMLAHLLCVAEQSLKSVAGSHGQPH